MTQPANPYTFNTPGLQGPPGPTSMPVATVATLSTVTANDATLGDGALALVTASGFRALWRLDKTSTLTIDGVTVVATYSGTGRWILNSRYSGRVPVEECGAIGNGTTDDTAAINAIWAALAGTGVEVLHRNTYLVSTPLVPQNFLTVRGAPTAAILSSVNGGTGIATNSAIGGGITTFGTSTTLSVTPTIGTKTATLTTVPTGTAKGSFLLVSQQAAPIIRQALFQVKNIAGSVITLDRPWQMQGFASGDTVQLCQPIQNFRLHGDGMTIKAKAGSTGPGGRYLEIYGGWDCLVEDLIFDPVNGAPVERLMSWDAPSYNCRALRIRGDGAGSTSIGYSCESANSCSFEDCIADNIAGPAYYFQDATACFALDCEANACQTGVTFGAATTGGGYINSLGSVDCWVQGGNINGSTANAVVWNTAAFRCKAIGLSISSTTGDAFNIGGAVSGVAGTTTDPMIVGCTSNGAGGHGIDTTANVLNLQVTGTKLLNCNGVGSNAILIASGCKGTVINGLTVDGCTQLFDVSSDLVLNGVQGTLAAGGPGPAALQRSGANIKASNLEITFNGSGVIYVFNILGGVGRYTSCDVTEGTTNVGFITNGAGAIYLENVTVAPLGAATGTYGLFGSNAGAVHVIGFGCDFTATANPITNSGGAISVTQGQGIYTNATTTGTVTLTQVQAMASSMKFSQSLSGNITYNVPAGYPGLWNVDLSGVTLNAHTFTVGVTSGSGVSLSAAQHIVYSDGTNMHTVV